jgi:large subunit ribosomal protein L6
MSRIGKKPVPLPKGVKVKMEEGKLMVTGPRGTLSQLMPPRVHVNIGAQEITLEPQDDSRLSRSYWGLVFNIGYSNPVEFPLPKGITAKVEKANRIEFTGANKEVLGQTVAVIRRLRPPDPYKGKGIRYAGEVIRRKVGKAGGR